MITFKAQCIHSYDKDVFKVGVEYTFISSKGSKVFPVIDSLGNYNAIRAAWFRVYFTPGTRTDLPGRANVTELPEALKVTCLCCGNKPRVLEQEIYGEQVGVQSECCGHKETALFQLEQIKTINTQGGWTAFLSK